MVSSKLAWYDIRQYVAKQRKAFFVLMFSFGLALFAFCYLYTYFTGVKHDPAAGGQDTYVVNIVLPELPDSLPVITQSRDAALRQFIAQNRYPALYALRYEGPTYANRNEGEILTPAYNVGEPYYVIGIDPNDTGRMRFGVETTPEIMEGRWLKPEDAGTHTAVVHWTLATAQDPLENNLDDINRYSRQDDPALAGIINKTGVYPMPPRVQLMHDDVSYNVVGKGDFFTDFSSDYSIAIPLDTYIAEQYPIQNIQLLFPTSVSGRQQEKLAAYVSELFPGFTFKADSTYSDNTGGRVSRYAYQLMNAGYMSLLACINALSIFVFWLKSNMRQYTVYLMHGLSAKRLKGTLAIEVLIITLLGFAVGLAVFALMQAIIPTAENYLYSISWWEVLVMMAGIELFIQVSVDTVFAQVYTNDALIDQLK
nr:FtsX-like permease family protein [Maliibacterium massiliense]